MRSTYVYAMAMQTGGDTQGTHRIPPSWTPGTNYAWRDFERDVANWVRLTDLVEEQHGPAVFQRLGGMAKVLAREIPEQVIAEGADGVAGIRRPGLSVLMDALRQRWGGEAQNRQLELLAAYENFQALPREDYEDLITRFDVCRVRARDEAGHQVGYPSLTRKLLLVFNVPEDQWATILAPTQGMLPMTEAQYNDFVSYLKRHLALFFRRSNVVHPVPPPSLVGAPGGP